MRNETSDGGAKVRNYAIAGFCIMLTVLALAVFSGIFFLFGYGQTPATIFSECKNYSANLFIGANKDIKDVKCIALDREFFENPEIVLGDLSKSDEDVCRFKLSKDAAGQPLRFEVSYGGNVKREVCSWQNYHAAID